MHNKKDSQVNDDVTFIQETKNKCVEKSKSARKHIIELFEDVYLLLNRHKNNKRNSLIPFVVYLLLIKL